MDDMWKLLAGGAALGVVASFWTKIKGVIWRICSLFVQQAEIPTEFAHNALVAYLVTNKKRSRTYDRMFGAWHAHRRDGRYGLVAYEQFGNRSMIFWHGWIPFYFSNTVESKANGKTKNESGGDDEITKIYSTLTFVRGTVDVEQLLLNACNACNQQSWDNDQQASQKNSRFVIHYVPKRGDEENHRHQNGTNGLAWYQQGYYRLLGITPDELGKFRLTEGSALENLIFPQRVKQLIREIELWRNNRDWYLNKGIPWKRGWLLYGPPGTGKTALARAFAEDLNMPIYVFNLAEMSNHELMKSWREMQVNIPCIALIEDIDNVFHGRENVSRKTSMMPMFFSDNKSSADSGKENKDKGMFTPLTFDCLLNCLDGVERTDGIFTIITTNDLSKIDPALGQPRKLPDGSTEFISTRPGRVDKAVELSYMEVGDKRLMAHKILGEYAAALQQMLEFIDRYPDLEETPAQFQERCGQVALRCFWNEEQLAVVESETLVDSDDVPERATGNAISHGLTIVDRTEKESSLRNGKTSELPA
ncbi:MAG: AAA family ATPase [Zavarzinella sp.]